jgi:signal transduction histidine kinase
MRTQQILINLLTNAIKFSHQDSIVFITVLTIQTSDTEILVKIMVKDQGIGINAVDLKHLFMPHFKTTDS